MSRQFAAFERAMLVNKFLWLPHQDATVERVNW
jgi:hypothetical protein